LTSRNSKFVWWQNSARFAGELDPSYEITLQKIPQRWIFYNV